MRQYNLDFIDSDDLFHHVRETVLQYRFEIDLEKFNSSLVDPIKLTFDSLVYRTSVEQTVQREIARQLDKSNNNHIGYFHQNIFHYIGGDKWFVPQEGFDIVNPAKQIFVELKNKHNTMNHRSSKSTFIKMQHTITLKNQHKTPLKSAQKIALKNQHKNTP